jgi:hypothetical protein
MSNKNKKNSYVNRKEKKLRKKKAQNKPMCKNKKKMV